MGPLEYIYYLGYSLKKSHSLKVRKRLPFRVVSVGNLTVGGTGKTPAVIALASEAQKRGHLPCILTRGYRGKAKGPCFVSRGEGPLLGAAEAGDEPVLMAERLKGVPIVKGADRCEAGLFALREFDLHPSSFSPHPWLFILDDGFQHWRLFRDTDILLIDGTDPFGNRKLLPAGRLREPLSEMGRADIIVITKRSLNNSRGKERSGRPPIDDLVEEIRDVNPRAPLYTAEHLATGLRTPGGADLSLDALAGKRVLAFCGIGNPSSFKDTLLAAGARIEGDILSFMDHISYSEKEVGRICEEARKRKADWIVTTEKDIMKLTRFPFPEDLAALLVALRIEFSVAPGFYKDALREA